VTDADLIRRAEAAGIAHRYRDWRGADVAVSEETLTAILAALGDAGAGTGAGAALGPARPAAAPGPAGSAAVAPVPAGRSWGFAVQLYSLRSRASWGHGDLHDLAELAAWSARDLGAGFR